MHFWSVHRDARNFSYPDTFWPDRWLIAEGIQESKEKITHNPDAFIPFSFGPANCVGKNLAMASIEREGKPKIWMVIEVSLCRKPGCGSVSLSDALRASR